MECPQCGGRDIDLNEAGGHAACVQCGTVVEENTIVSSIEFQESNDRSHVIGQFVSATCSKPYNAGRARGRFGNTRESRDATLAAARRNIQQVASSLRLPPIYVDKAYRLYQLALQKNFIFGRRQMHVVATCLYTICRQEKSPHLLIDFSDALQVNVYILGKSFLQFARMLHLTLPVVDPALYIHRFSARLDLGDKMNLVSTTALRIVTRLKKDWINSGRRPDGVCAAAMLIAARSHGFHKSQTEIGKIFRVSTDTLKKRLQDFKATPSAQLTIDEFHQHDAALEFDPPSFIQHQVQEYAGKVHFNLGESAGNTNRKRIRLGGDDDNDDDVDDEDTSDNNLEGSDQVVMVAIDGTKSVVVKLPSMGAPGKTVSRLKARRVMASQALYYDIYTAMDKSAAESEFPPEDSATAFRMEADDVQQYCQERLKGNLPSKRRIRLDASVQNSWSKSMVSSAQEEDTSSSSSSSSSDAASKKAESSVTDKESSGFGPALDEAPASSVTAIVVQRPVFARNGKKMGDEEVAEDEEEVEESEIDGYILSEEEKKKRFAIRDKLYGEFMAERARKKKEKAGKEEEASLRAASSGKTRKKGSRREQNAKESSGDAPSAAQPRGKSRKINYEKQSLMLAEADAVPQIAGASTTNTASSSSSNTNSNSSSNKGAPVPNREEFEEEEDEDEGNGADDDDDDEYEGEEA